MTKRKNQPTKYDQDQIHAAKQMYMQYSPIKEIERSSGMTRSAINYYINQSWSSEREERKNAIISSFSSSKSVDMTHIMRDGIAALIQAVKATLMRAADLSLAEMTQLTKILESMDKIARLDSGKATDIRQEQKARETVEVVNPFAEDDIEDADVVIKDLD